MIITCEQCEARFRLADEKLKSGGTKVRCSKCKHVFLVMPPDESPDEETVDFGSFNMEKVAEPEAAPEPPAPVPAGGDVELDFSGLEQTMAPGSGEEPDEEFSFADTSAPAAASESPEPSDFESAPTMAGPAFSGAGEASGELDFDATFAETESPAAAATATAGFEFTGEPAGSSVESSAEETATFSFTGEPVTAAGEEFSFRDEPVAAIGEEFSFDDGKTEPAVNAFDAAESADENAFTFGAEAAEPAPPAEGAIAFGDDSAEPAAAGPFSFDAQESPGTSPFDTETAFGEETTATWDQPVPEEGPSFDFDEPSFETKLDEKPPKRGEDAGLGFGEIDFSNSDGEEKSSPPSFGPEPDFAQATLARPAEPEAPPPPPPPPRPAASRAGSEEPLAAPIRPRKSPISRVVVMLALLLMVLSGAAAYFYFMGNGRELAGNLLLKLKGEEPAAPLEQRIGLNIEGSSYVDNREAGQLLVIQGSATNNFTGSRSAITVKGLILDAAGKTLQQQTVFCGNYLSEEKLRAMKYAQVEEAMNNQFGDSLANMNVKPGAAIPFTIVFRNIPKEMANINVEVVDSKPGGA